MARVAQSRVIAYDVILSMFAGKSNRIPQEPPFEFVNFNYHKHRYSPNHEESIRKHSPHQSYRFLLAPKAHNSQHSAGYLTRWAVHPAFSGERSPRKRRIPTLGFTFRYLVESLFPNSQFCQHFTRTQVVPSCICTRRIIGDHTTRVEVFRR